MFRSIRTGPTKSWNYSGRIGALGVIKINKAPAAFARNYFVQVVAIGYNYCRSHMELRHARYFVAVAEELNFRRAAGRLHLAQPSLSAQIRLLEEDVGVQLLDRDSHKVELTPAGRSFLEGCRRLLRDADDCGRTARRVARGESVPLSLGFVPSLAHGFLPRVLRLFRQRFPDLQLFLTEMDSTAQVEQIAANRIDLGLIGLGLPKDIPDLDVVVVAEERLVAALPQDHLLVRRPRKSIPLKALANEHFLLGSRLNAPVFNPWIIVLCQQAGFQPHVVQESGQPITVLNYVAAGLGVTIVPEQFSRLVSAGVRFIPLARPTPTYRYCAARMRNNHNPVVEHFIQVAREVGQGEKKTGPTAE
jgi:DNA-binding transcriptional LysR family regulator